MRFDYEKEVTQDLLLRKTISTLFLKTSTHSEQIRTLRGLEMVEPAVDCIDVDALDRYLHVDTKAK